MALAVRAGQLGRAKAQMRFLLITIFFGLAFLGIKGFEYAEHFHEHLFPGPAFNPKLANHTQLFFVFYFAMTGLHAIHVIVGVGLLAVIALMVRHRPFTSSYYTPIEMTGLYWHFVDIVWVFLYPLMYLINRHIS
jgi:cytochrome c oxidase subunit 3